MAKLNMHSPIYFMKDHWEKWLNLRHTFETECTKKFGVQYFQIGLHNDDNEVIWCANKRIPSSVHDVLYHLQTSQDCRVIKDNKKTFPGCLWQHMIVQPLQAHNHGKIWQQWGMLILPIWWLFVYLFIKTYLPRITHQPKAVLHEVLLHTTTITC